MKRAGLSLLLIAATVPAFAALKQGDTAPQFKTQASLAGKEFTFSLADGKCGACVREVGARIGQVAPKRASIAAVDELFEAQAGDRLAPAERHPSIDRRAE